ncbi:MAG TPA: glycosyltransferase family 4 protein [Vicinamibacterales bacterium]|nr:glycosyltransferase family 4 protein [Vicinamibacterales bacterium]
MLTADWICCHLGAREHYVIPRALHHRGRLRLLITDAWVRPGSLWARMPMELVRRLSERFHPELTDAPVRPFTRSLLSHEAWWRSRDASGWQTVIARNEWFARRASHVLRRLPAGPRPVAVFAHSYSARDVFRVAKARGWTTVLGQIDPGEEHFRVLGRLAERHPEYGAAPEMPPDAYFRDWRDECALADRIIVNSEWSRESLLRAGIAGDKLRVVPLAFTDVSQHDAPVRDYPQRFTADRPLRLLFVGQASVAKGVPSLLEAIDLTADLPIALELVGHLNMTVPARFRGHPRVRWTGAVSRGDVMRHYRDSDLLVFPSHSDGFGMAQIEAQAFGLPIVASSHCGRVVEDGVNGLLLPEVSPEAIALVLRRIAAHPEVLRHWSRGCAVAKGDLLAGVADALQLA